MDTLGRALRQETAAAAGVTAWPQKRLHQRRQTGAPCLEALGRICRQYEQQLCLDRRDTRECGRALEERMTKQVESLPHWLNPQEAFTSHQAGVENSLVALWVRMKACNESPSNSLLNSWRNRTPQLSKKALGTFLLLWCYSLSLFFLFSFHPSCFILCLSLPLSLSPSLSVCLSPCTLKSHCGCVSLSIPGSWGKAGGRAGVQAQGWK